MPATKDDFTVYNAFSLSAGGGPSNSGYQDLRLSYGGIWQIKVTNNALNPLGKGVVVQVEISPDQVSGNEYPFDCRFVAGQDVNQVSKVAIRVPPEAKFTRLHVEHGDEAATITAIFTRLTQV